MKKILCVITNEGPTRLTRFRIMCSLVFSLRLWLNLYVEGDSYNAWRTRESFNLYHAYHAFGQYHAQQWVVYGLTTVI